MNTFHSGSNSSGAASGGTGATTSAATPAFGATAQFGQANTSTATPFGATTGTYMHTYIDMTCVCKYVCMVCNTFVFQ